MYKKFLLPTLLVSMFFSGCASVPMGDPVRDIELKRFRAPMEKAGVFIYRNEIFGAEVRMDILVDGRDVGSTAARTFVYVELEPGTHLITSKAPSGRDSIELNLTPGSLTFLWQEVKMGGYGARTKIHLVTEEQGKRGVLESLLVVP